MRRIINFLNIFIFVSIVLSCIIIPLDYIYPQYRRTWIKWEIFFAAVFCIEYIVRWILSKNKFKYPFTFYAIIDLIAILPTLLLISNNFLFLRLFRIARFLRLLKLIRYNHYLYNSLNNMKNRFFAFREEYQLDNLGNLFIWCVIALIVGANLVYFTEIKFGDETSPYIDYWKSYWHMVIVLVSGIEDKEPVSLAGKLEVTVLLVAGICVVGMVTAEIVSILVRKFNRKGKVYLKPLNSVMENHIVILGYNNHLDYVIRQIHHAFNGQYYILGVFEKADEFLATIPHIYEKVVVVKGDPLSPEILNKANIDKALRVIVLSEKKLASKTQAADYNSLMTSIAVNFQNRKVPVTVQLKSFESFKYNKIINNTDFIVSSIYMEKLISQAVLNPGVTEIYRSLLTFTKDSNEFYKIPVYENFENFTFRDIQKYFADRKEAVIPVGIYRFSQLKKKHICRINPLSPKKDSELFSDSEFLLKKGDALLVIAYEQPDFEDPAKKKKSITKIFWNKRLKFKAENYFSSGTVNRFLFTSLRNNNVVICNINSNIKNIAEELLDEYGNRIFNITIIVQSLSLWDSNPQWHPDYNGDRLKIIFGDPAKEEVLEQACVKDCGAAVILADPLHKRHADAPSTLTAMAIEKINPEIHTIMELIESANRKYIDFGIINEVVCRGDITEKLIAQNCYHPGIINVFDELLTSGKGTPQIYLPEIPFEFHNRSYGEVYSQVLAGERPFLLIGFIQNMNYYINPKKDNDPGFESFLHYGDRLIIIAHTFQPNDLDKVS